MPEASPVMARLGWPGGAAELLFKLGGDPVANRFARRFVPLVELEIELDMRLYILI
jgi:hypothetical protein